MTLETRKLYVGGIPWAAQEQDLWQHFTRYGEVRHVRVVRDMVTGKSRGFGFVEFADAAVANSALDMKEETIHVMGGRTVVVKRAKIRSMLNRNAPPFYPQNTSQSAVHSQGPNQFSSSGPNKIFLGGLRNGITKEDLTSYFQTFGNINDVVIIHDCHTLKSRGFGFITFESKDAVGKVLENAFHVLNGIRVQAKLAIPQHHHEDVQDSQQYNSMTWHDSSHPNCYDVMVASLNAHYMCNGYYIDPVGHMYPPWVVGYRGYMMNRILAGDHGYMNGILVGDGGYMMNGTAPMMYQSYGTSHASDSANTNFGNQS